MSLLGYKSWGCKRDEHDLATEQQHPPMNRAMVACFSAQPPDALLKFFFNDLLQYFKNFFILSVDNTKLNRLQNAINEY